MIVPPKMLSNENVEINLSVVHDICENDPEIFKCLALTFIKTSNYNIQKLNDFFTNEDYIQLKNTAHACRSSLSIFKCSDLYDLMMNIESLSKQRATSIQLIENLKLATNKYGLMLDLLIAEFDLFF